MTPQVISLSSLGSTAWIPVDYKQNPFNIGLACVVSNTPNLTYQVEFTLDDIFNTSITPTAFAHSLLVGKTSDFSSNQTVPVRAIRLTTTAYTSGTVTLTALQGGVNPIIYTPNPVTLYQSSVPFCMLSGDGGANGLSFTGTRGVFTLSAAVVTNFWQMLAAGGYAYLPPGAGGLANGGWYWCVMTSDTAGEIFSNTHSGTGTPQFVASPTVLPDLSAGRIIQTTSDVVLTSFTMPGNSMGPNGNVSFSCLRFGDTSATGKALRVSVGGSLIANTTTTTSPVGESIFISRNLGVANKQANSRSLGIGAYGATVASHQYTAVDTSVDNIVSIIMAISATTASHMICGCNFSVQYGA